MDEHVDSQVSPNASASDNEIDSVKSTAKTEDMKIKGGCSKSGTFGHDVFGCQKCDYENHILNCTITICACKGDGFLFPIQGYDFLFVHQMQNMSKSVYVDLTKPETASENVQKLIDIYLPKISNECVSQLDGSLLYYADDEFDIDEKYFIIDEDDWQ